MLGKLGVCCALVAVTSCVSVHVERDGNAEQTIRTLEDEWGRILIRRDSVAFARMLAPGFVYTENEQLMTRDQLLKDVKTSSDTVTSFLNEDLKVLVRGSTAIATGFLTLRGRGSAGAFDRKYRFTDTWVREDGRWRILGAQDYLMPR